MIKQNKAVYAETIDVFFNDVRKNIFVEKMMNNSIKCGFIPSDSEINSWQENSNELSTLFTKTKLSNDVVIAFEYKAPLDGRVDCILFGQDNDYNNNIVIIELKGWKDATLSYNNKLVNTYTGGRPQDVLHPLNQVEQYHRQFTDFLDIFSSDNYHLTSLSYCYNYEKKNANNILFHENFDLIRKDFQLFVKNDDLELAKHLSFLLINGNGVNIIETMSKCQPFPTEKLIDAAANIMIDEDNFHLYGDQSITYDKILSIVKDSIDNKKKSVFVVKGGPGTGKTLIALKVMSAMARDGKSTMFATRSTALRDDLKRALSETAVNGKNASNLIQDIYRFRPSQYYENQIDVLLVDEAHRVAQSANTDKTGRYQVQIEHEGEGNPYCPLSQTMSLIYCSKVTVFFIDDHQAIKTSEIGQSEDIVIKAKRYQEQLQKEINKFQEEQNNRESKINKTILKYDKDKEQLETMVDSIDSNVFTEKMRLLAKKKRNLQNQLNWSKGLKNIRNEYKDNVYVDSICLKTQFRCSGGDKFVAWLDEVLYKNSSDIKIRLKKDDFNFSIFDNPKDLYSYIKELDSPLDNRTARLCAGWCWPWSDKQVDTETGDLKKEVQIGDFMMPWETKQRPFEEPYRSLYAPDTNSWMSNPMGINQIGCIYTAQGFEFDNVGVIIGPDLVFDESNNRLRCIREHNMEKNMNDSNADILIRNIYRVLMSRGKLSCAIFCCDPKVANYLKRFIIE